MSNISQEQLDAHKAWVYGKDGGKYLCLQRAILTGARFNGMVLEDADFSKAILVGADFRGAALGGANFSNAILTGANFSHAYVTDADFTGAILTGATFMKAHLVGAKFDYQIHNGLLQQVAQAALETPNSLLQGMQWHTTDTIHCLAGWACHLSPVARELERTHGTEIAALLTLGAEAHSHFFDETATAREWLKSIFEV